MLTSNCLKTDLELDSFEHVVSEQKLHIVTEHPLCTSSSRGCMVTPCEKPTD